MNRHATAVLAALLLAACSQPTTPTSEVRLTASSSASPKAAPAASASPARLRASSIVTGVVKAPKGIAGVIPTGGGHVIPTGGGHVIVNNGGNVIPTGGGNLLRLLATRGVLAVTEAPLANTEVFLADAAGNAYPNIAPVTTDAEGRFTFEDVPPGFTVTVVARGRDEARAKDVTLQTIVKTSELGATTAIDTATSMVTLAVLQGESEIGDVNAATFRTATEATAKGLTDADVPDLSDRTAILAKVEALAGQIAELKEALDEIREDLADIKASIDEINQKLGAPQQTVPAWQPPPPPPPQPQPGGVQPPPGPTGGGCTPVPHEFELTGTYANYPLRLDFLTRSNTLAGQVRFEKPGAVPALAIPDVCPHRMVLWDARNQQVVAYPEYGFPAGSAKRIKLPF